MSSTPSPSSSSQSAFKRAQVRYRRQGVAPNRIDDLDELIDFSNPNENRVVRITTPSLKHGYQGPLFGLRGDTFSGFLYAPQALSPNLQLQMAYQSVSEFCEAPHATNIDGVPPKPNEIMVEQGEPSMWDLWKKNAPGSSKQCHYRQFSKLSWATCGYQYDWTARAYHERAKSVMPRILEQLSQTFAATSLLLEQRDNSDTLLNFTPSACIVNYYHNKSIMGGHVDDLELATDKPVISLSVGLPAIFLLGGTTKDDVPIAPLLVRPGDVMILGGACRMKYHGMARVIPTCVTLPEAVIGEMGALDATASVPDEDLHHLMEFLKRHRININVRQVLPDGMDCIPPKHLS